MRIEQVAGRRFTGKAIVGVALVSVVVGLVVASGLNLTPHSRAARFWSEADGGLVTRTAAESREPYPDLAPLVKARKDAVVNISTSKRVRVPGGHPEVRPGPPGERDPFRDFFERFFGGEGGPREFRQRSLGSGVLINKEGYILTNNHVVENTDEVLVKLADGKEYPAEIVGRDAKTDLALIRIKADHDLPVAPLGDSDKLEQGDWVMAIGNPFGLAHTVTVGIVSGKGRVIGQGPYDDFIQTDASINPGNSGGPLFNMRGEVVGINTAIFSQSGGSMGIGFAIPINVAKGIVLQLKDRGKVTRAWLGVVIQPVTKELADSFGMDKERGALVSEVVKDSPADKSGIKRGDVVVQFNGKEISEMRELPRLVAGTPVGSEAEVRVVREGKERLFRLKLGELPEEQVAVGRGPGDVEKALGMTVQELTPEIARGLGLSEEKGVVVSNVDSASVAEKAGVRRGDLIKEVNRQAVSSLREYKAAVEATKKGQPVLLLVRRGDSSLFVALKAER